MSEPTPSPGGTPPPKQPKKKQKPAPSPREEGAQESPPEEPVEIQRPPSAYKRPPRVDPSPGGTPTSRVHHSDPRRSPPEDGVAVFPWLKSFGTPPRTRTFTRPEPYQRRPKFLNKPPKLIKGVEWPEDLRVTVTTSVLGRQTTALNNLPVLKSLANFPSRFVVLVNPSYKGLINWCKKAGFEVWTGGFAPIVKTKKWMMDGLKTEFLLIHDPDWIPQSSYKPMLELMDAKADIGVIAPLMEHPRQKLCLYGSLLKEDPKHIFRERLSKQTITTKHRRNPWFYCDYVTMSSMLVRAEVLKEVTLDDKFGQGLDHGDFFWRLKKTKWKTVSYKNIICASREFRDTPGWYRQLRFQRDLVDRSIMRFIEKWDKPMAYTKA